MIFNTIKILPGKNLFMLCYSVFCLVSCSTWDTESRLIIENKTELELNVKIKFCKSEKSISLGPLEKSKAIEVICSGDNVSLFAKLMQPGPLPFYLKASEVGSIKGDQKEVDLSNQINYDQLNYVQIWLIEGDSLTSQGSVNQKFLFKLGS